MSSSKNLFFVYAIVGRRKMTRLGQGGGKTVDVRIAIGSSEDWVRKQSR